MTKTAIDAEQPVISTWVASAVPQPTLPEIEAVLADFLDPRERIIWCAQPNANSIKDLEAAKSTAWWFPTLLGVGFLGFVVFAVATHIKTYLADPGNLMNFWMALVIGVVNLGIGIACLLSPARSRSNAQYTLYAITNARVIIFEPAETPGPRQKTMHWKFTAIDRTALRDIQSRKLPGRDELQDVLLTYHEAAPLFEQSRIQQRGDMPVETTIKTGFYGVPATSNVEELLRNLRSGALSAS